MEAEGLKLISQLGSFGLMAVFVMWVLFRGAPMLKETFADMGAKHQSGMDAMAENHKEAVGLLTKDCAEASRELFRWFSAEMEKRDKALEQMASTLDRMAKRGERYDGKRTDHQE